MNPLERAQIEGWLMGVNVGIDIALGLFLMFQIKHLIVDFFIQNRYPYMWLNKHKLFHPGGWLHAGGHAVASFGIFYIMQSPFAWVKLALSLCFFEVLVHFAIDCAKMRIGARTGWKCNTSPYFWDLLGVDQFLHQATYIVMIYIWSTNLL